MKKTIYIFSIFCLFLSSCEKNEIVSPETYNCSFVHNDLSAIHPKAAIYQSILDKNRKLGIVGASLMIKDKYGIWVGSSGKADIASNVNVKPCNRFLIASISKVFTAAAVFRYIDQGLLSLDDKVSDFLANDIVNKIENAESATIRHLLNHTSGIADYYTVQHELDRINTEYNNWRQEDVLKYVYGKNATHKVGETYYYSNTNFLLLGIILEKVSGQSLEDVYQNQIFSPLQLTSAYYGKEIPIPSDVVKGYFDIYGNGQYVESEFLYKDELNTADGGIIINAYDLGVFFEALMKGQLISDNSLNEMTAWFDLPEGLGDEDFGHFQNGLGLEHNNTDYGLSVGHTGGIDGFLSIAQYFPNQDATFILLVNSASSEDLPRLNIYNQILEEMFK
jgi:D-alanyl-D-alanine carboxypeptidase